MEELLPSKFTWEECGIRLGYHVYDFIKHDDNGNILRINKEKYKLLGFCDSMKLPVRPAKNQIAVLFEIFDENEILEKVWIHFPNRFKHLFKKESN